MDGVGKNDLSFLKREVLCAKGLASERQAEARLLLAGFLIPILILPFFMFFWFLCRGRVSRGNVLLRGIYFRCLNHLRGVLSGM